MKIWFLENQPRLLEEKEAIERLEHEVDWLSGSNWFVNEGLLNLEAKIQAHGHEYDVVMTYPHIFPDAPPIVRPKEDVSWSTHQYVNGVLCLEYGPDNWTPDITGAQMLQSAYRLFDIENPLGQESQEDRPVVAQSRHLLTVGQQVRSDGGVFYIGQELIDHVGKISDDRGLIKFAIPEGENFRFIVHEAGGKTDTSIPSKLGGDSLLQGMFFKVNSNDELPELNSFETIGKLLLESGHPIDFLNLATPASWEKLGFTSRPHTLLLIDGKNQPYLIWLTTENKIFRFIPALSDSVSQRLPDSYSHLKDKKVGIVGIGSAGSKIALSLARMGVKKFVLVDHDILLPENIQRHSLDWRHVAEHKTKSLKTQLEYLANNMSVKTSELHLTGQESNAALSSRLKSLGECDIILDATADGGVFNLLANVAKNFEKPLVWLQIFGGGLGGLIARSRPSIDSSPQTIRATYDAFCNENPAPNNLTVKNNYEAESSEGKILAASDADVAIIANYAASLAADSLKPKEESKFPYSLYLVGLDRGWVFEAPFHTIPIGTSNQQQESPPHSLTEEEKVKVKSFLENLISDKLNK